MPYNPGNTGNGWHNFSTGEWINYDPTYVPLAPYIDYIFTTEWQPDFGFGP
jgi:hypothetical protein